MKGGQLRICRIVPDFLLPEQAYGYFISFLYISMAQRDKGHKVLILKPANNFRIGSVTSFPIVSIPLKKRGLFPSDRKQFLRAIRAVVNSWDADIIHTHISAGSYLHGTRKLPPTVHHLHGLPYKALEIWKSLRKIGQKKERLWDLRHDLHADSLYRRYLKLANAVIVYCPSLKAYVIQRYRVPPDNVHMVFNGVSPDFLTFYSKLAMRKELDLDEDCFLVLFVGRVVEGKGIVPLLKALQLVRRIAEGKDIRLLIIGSQFGFNWLQSLVHAFKSREDFVIEFPHVQYEHLPKYYAAADLHVLNHTFGSGVPKTCLESLACGTPVIITRTLDTEIIIGQNERGLLLNNATDYVGLAKKILYFVNHEDMAREMGERGRRLIRKKFTWAKTVENLTTIYRNILEAS